MCAYEGAGVIPLSYPAALARVAVGSGTLYLDGVRWDRAARDVARSAERIGSLLLYNLGVRFNPRQPPQKLEGLTYVPLDIRAHLNRALADEKAEDGQGGWTDQGPDADMRQMPTGRQTFAGVPFDIATPLSCLVLASKYRQPGPPEAVTGIRVGRKAAALYFLQSSAWTSPGLHATYRIHYADGTTVDVPLVGGVNYRDWAATDCAAPFEFEQDTFTQVGWTGTSKTFAKVSAYVMEWRNPHPEKLIDSFDFISANNGVPILLAVTAGERPAAPAAISGDMGQAAQLDAEARAAAEAGDKARALELARQAVAVGPGHVPARLRLGDLLEEAGELEAAEAQFREVIRLQPDQLEAYMRIGRICEARQRWADAREIYRRSLEVNVNQPLVMQALERLKQRESR